MLAELWEITLTAYTWTNLGWMFLGVTLGASIGAIPGLGPSMAIAIALPITYTLPPLSVLGILIGIYKASMFGGSLSAILLGTPGTAAASATVFDGYALAKQGKAGKALRMALLASVIGDTTSDVVTILLTVPLAVWALRVGPTEQTAIILLAMILVAFLSGPSPIKGLLAGLLGVTVGLVGMDPIGGRARFTFGILELESGIGLVPVMLGIFAVAEVIRHMVRKPEVTPTSFAAITSNPEDNKLTWPEIRSCIPTIVRSTVLGIIIGILPGLGSSAAAFLGYGVGQRLTKDPKYGKGSLEGIAAAEAANSATVGPTLILLLALGIPGSAIAALLGGALLMQGIQPGPTLLQGHAHVIYPFFVLMLTANVVNRLVGTLLIRVAPAVLRLPTRIIFPTVLMLCVAGVYASERSVFAIGVMMAMGLLGYLMSIGGYPVGPFILAYLLSPILERSLRRTLLISGGDYSVFLRSPLSVGMLLLALLLLVVYVRGLKRDKTPLAAA